MCLLLHCSAQNWEKGTHWAEALRKQLSSHLLFVEFKTTIQIPILRVLGKMLQFKTAGHPYCHMHPCLLQSLEGGQAGREKSAGAALSEHLQELQSVCLCWEVFVSQLMAGNSHRQTPNSKDLMCITLSFVPMHLPSSSIRGGKQQQPGSASCHISWQGGLGCFAHPNP